jgi:hypothetical protein
MIRLTFFPDFPGLGVIGRSAITPCHTFVAKHGVWRGEVVGYSRRGRRIRWLFDICSSHVELEMCGIVVIEGLRLGWLEWLIDRVTQVAV